MHFGEVSMEPQPGPAERWRQLRGGIGCITIPLLILAAVPLSWGARNRWRDGVLLRNGVAVSGRVTDVRYAPDKPSITFTGRQGRGSKGRSPVVEFTTRTGETRTAIGSINRDPPEYKVGDVAEVLYDPDDPRRADVRSELRRWRFWFSIWTALGLALAALAFSPILLHARDLLRPRTAGGA
jgi:hypothetical protein